MITNLDQVTLDKIRGLTMEYKEYPQSDLLIGLPNQNPGADYQVEITTSEFTSLCPLNTAQPDYATIVIRYRPEAKLVELKSLKFYLVSFRQVPIFHESVPATILQDLVKLLEPDRIVVEGYFSIRGGLDTVVKASFDSGRSL